MRSIPGDALIRYRAALRAMVAAARSRPPRVPRRRARSPALPRSALRRGLERARARRRRGSQRLLRPDQVHPARPSPARSGSRSARSSASGSSCGTTSTSALRPARDTTTSFLLTRLLVPRRSAPDAVCCACSRRARARFVTDRDLPGGARKSDVDQLDLQNGFLDAEVAGVGGRRPRAARRPPGDVLRRAAPGEPARLGQHAAHLRRRLRRSYSWQGWQATGFWARPCPVNRYAFNEWGPEDDLLRPVRERRAVRRDARADLYWLGLDRDDATFNGTSGHEQRQTLGGRVFGALPGTGSTSSSRAPTSSDEVGASDVERLHGRVAARLVARDGARCRRASSSASTGRAATTPRAASVRDLQPALPALAPVLRLHRCDRRARTPSTRRWASCCDRCPPPP